MVMSNPIRTCFSFNKMHLDKQTPTSFSRRSEVYRQPQKFLTQIPQLKAVYFLHIPPYNIKQLLYVSPTSSTMFGIKLDKC